MLFGEENPHEFFGTATPSVTPEGDESSVPEGPNFSGRKGGNLDPIEGLGDSRSSDHFLLRTKGDGSSANDAGASGAER